MQILYLLPISATLSIQTLLCFLLKLYVAYKNLVSLPVTQVGCDRIFYFKTFTKRWLQNNLGQEDLESFILIYIEKVLNNLNNEKTLDTLANTLTGLKKIFLPW